MSFHDARAESAVRLNPVISPFTQNPRPIHEIQPEGSRKKSSFCSGPDTKRDQHAKFPTGGMLSDSIESVGMTLHNIKFLHGSKGLGSESLAN